MLIVCREGDGRTLEWDNNRQYIDLADLREDQKWMKIASQAFPVCETPSWISDLRLHCSFTQHKE